MKVLAKFLLPSVFVFFTGVPVWAQDCGHESIFWNNDERSIITDLVKRQDCLNNSLTSLKMSVEHLDFQLSDNHDPKIDILDLQNQLEQTKLDLRAAEMEIKTLQHSYDMLSRLFDRMLNDRLKGSGLAAPKPKAPASKPKAQGNKPKPVAP